MNSKPLVCICIPSYNNENTISETLGSILNQTYKNIIIKIFDNASTDASIEIIKEYENKYNNIQLFKNEKNIGGEANFTKCIEGLEGDYGAIYHADDIYESIIVETQVKYLSKNDISAVFVRADLIDDNGNNIGEQFFPKELKNKSYHQFDFNQLFTLILKYDNFLITPSVMAKVDIYKNKIKSWNGTKFKTSADLDVWLRFSEVKEIGLITDKLMSYRLSTASFSYRTKFSRVVTRDMFLVIGHYLNKYNDYGFEKSDYEFLKFKDNLLITGNKILNKNDVLSSEISLFNFRVFSKIFFNQQKFKIYLYGIFLKIFIALGKNNILNKVIKKVNNRPEEVKFE